MSAHFTNVPVEYREGPTIATLTVPALVAVLAFAMVMGMNGGAPPTLTGSLEDADAATPTPYSADHARVQRGPGAAEEQPATF